MSSRPAEVDGARTPRARAGWRRGLAGGALGLALGLAPGPAAANPNVGEPRPLVRDADRVYTVVAGEADGASTVTNPANLGFLRGANGILDLALMDPARGRRGSGLGLFLGLPLPLRLAAVGLGYQLLLPWQPEGLASEDGLSDPDDFYNKVTMAVSVPMGPWWRLIRPGERDRAKALDGLSLGLSYSRLLSASNLHAHGTNQVDVAVSYWPIRYLALGVVGRAINLPRIHIEYDTGNTVSGRHPVVIDPELAVRPLGTPALEVAVGARISPVRAEDTRFRTNVVDPRARVAASLGGARVFAEAEMMRFNADPTVDPDAAARIGARIQAGVELHFARFGLAAAPLSSAGMRNSYGVDGAALRLRLSQERYPSIAGRPRVVTKLALAKYGGDRGMWDVVALIDAAAERRGTVLIETRGMSLGYAQLEEIREAVLRVRNRGGKVVAYMEGGSLASYFLASAADRIVAHPGASLEILGLKVQTLYYHELLERLGAKPEFVRVAEYKAWPETVHRDTASRPVAEQRRMLQADLWNHVLRMIARERGQDVRVIKGWIDEAPIPPEDALRRGLVDDLAYPDELDAELEDWLGRRVRIEAPPRPPRVHQRDFGPPPRIAVLLVQGDLARGDSFTVPLVGRTVAGDRTLTKEIERLRKDPSVRAVVVRVDSPGGEVAAAEAIARELDLVRKVKPVVVSMGNTCASGGYYVATAGQYIVADATTFTGSIGVFLPKMDISGTLDKLGISVDEVALGRRAGMRSWLRGYTEDELAAAQADMDRSYGRFLARVAEARSMTLEQADRVARGRVWAGVRAIEEGLVDDYGGLREAILRARAIAGMAPDEGVVEVLPPPSTPLENLRSMFGFRLPSPLGAEGYGAALPSGLALRSVLPTSVLSVLRHLPVGLWWSDRPEVMAVAPETWIVAD
ncbi:MAG: signal peptide peptidase SppA [Myxococcales bacterium]|nr:signal peptide peptidase SppA [Myxococcales bacterium]